MFVEEFINACVQGGYISGPNQRQRLREWCNKHPKAKYSPEDFIDVYRDFQTLDITHEPRYTRQRANEDVVYITPARGKSKGSTWETVCEYLAQGMTVAVKGADGLQWFYPEDSILD